MLDASDAQCRMWEISENLHRADLTALERSEHIAEWVSLSNVSAQIAPKPLGGRPEGGINAATRELGIDRTDAQRAVKVAGLTPEAKQAARDSGLDNNRTALLEATKLTNAEAQLLCIRKEAEKREAHKRNKEVDRTIALTEAGRL